MTIAYNYLSVGGRIWPVVYGETKPSKFDTTTTADTVYQAYNIPDADGKEPIIKITGTAVSKAYDEWANLATASYTVLSGGH